MKNKSILSLGVLLLSLSAVAQKEAAPRLMPDKGKLKIQFESQVIGTEDFQISGEGGEWVSRSEVKIQLPGSPAAKITSTLRLSAQERPMRYEWALDSDRKISGSIVFDGGVANEELRQGTGEPFTQQHMFGDQRVVILDNNVYHHFAILGRLYDWQKKGPQTFSVYVPQETTPGSATLEAAGNQEVDGTKYDVLQMRTDELVIFLLFDKQRLMRISLPDSKVTVIRE